MSSLKKLVTDSMAIDMGTASTIIAVKGRDIVLDEPSLVAVNELTDEIVAYGQEAYDMRGREGRESWLSRRSAAAWSPISSARKKCSRISSRKIESGGSQVAASRDEHDLRSDARRTARAAERGGRMRTSAKFI